MRRDYKQLWLEAMWKIQKLQKKLRKLQREAPKQRSK